MRDCGDRHLGGGSDGQAYRSGRLVHRAAYCSGWLLILAAQSFNERPNRAGFMIALGKLSIAGRRDRLVAVSGAAAEDHIRRDAAGAVPISLGQARRAWNGLY
jgi:hypothetical protein